MSQRGRFDRVGTDALVDNIDRAIPELYAYVLRRCGGRALAEDLTSESILAAVDHINAGTMASIDVGYLIGIARHKLVDHWRRQEREQRHLRVFAGDRTDASADDHFEPGSCQRRAVRPQPDAARSSDAALHRRSPGERRRPTARTIGARDRDPARASEARLSCPLRGDRGRTAVMTDPFDVLRESATSAGTTVEIDPRFRAELLDEARRRLSGAPGAARRRLPSTADVDERTEMTVMPSDRARWKRPMLLAAACVVLVAVSVLALTTLEGSDGGKPADTPPVGVTTTVTTDPATSLPTGPPLTDEQLVAAFLLDPAELGLSRVEPVRGWEVTDTRDPHQFDLDRYSAKPECSAFDEVFKPLESSTHADRTFGLPPSQPADQIVAVFPDEATASSVFDGWLDPAFAPCLELYSYQWVFRFGAPTEPPFAVSADDFAYYTFEQPRGQINAGGLVRMGRTLTFVDASITWYEPARPLMSEEEFGRIIDRVVAHADAALAGTPLPAATTTTMEPLPPVSAAGTASPPRADTRTGAATASDKHASLSKAHASGVERSGSDR